MRSAEPPVDGAVAALVAAGGAVVCGRAGAAGWTRAGTWTGASSARKLASAVAFGVATAVGFASAVGSGGGGGEGFEATSGAEGGGGLSARPSAGEGLPGSGPPPPPPGRETRLTGISLALGLSMASSRNSATRAECTRNKKMARCKTADVASAAVSRRRSWRSDMAGPQS